MTRDLQSFNHMEYSRIKQIMNNPDSIITYFKLPASELDTLVHKLEMSVLGGIFEYKKDTILDILTPLESLIHNSKVMESIPTHIYSTETLLSAVLIQRLYVLKKLKLSGGKPSPAKTKDTNEQSVKISSLKEILEFVKKEAAKNPDMVRDTNVKKILMYSKMYQNEVKKMKALIISAPVEKQALMKENFKKSLQSILIKLNKSYRALTREEVPQKITRASTTRQIAKYDYSPVAPLIENQIQSFSNILSTLKYTEKEKFKTRELLVNLASEKKDYISLINREQKMYEEIDPFDKEGKKAGREIASELSKFFTRELAWLKNHPW